MPNKVPAPRVRKSARVAALQAAEECSLTQALCVLADERRAITDERAFRATLRNLPKRQDIRDLLVSLLATRQLTHVGELVVMDYDYECDQNGQESRHEVVLKLLNPSFTADAEYWHTDRVDFRLGVLDLPAIDRLMPPAGAGIDNPWLRLRDVRIPAAELLAARGTTLVPVNRGGRPVAKDWDAVWRTLIVYLLEEGTPHDKDAEWTKLNTHLTAAFTDLDPSAVRMKTRELRKSLRDAKHI